MTIKGRSGGRRRLPRVLVAVLLGLGVLAGGVAGCGGSDSPDPGTITDGIGAELERHPDVRNAELTYRNGLTSRGSVLATVVVVVGGDVESVADETLRLLWRSELEPLKRIQIRVIEMFAMQHAVDRTIDPVAEQTELESRYGPRP